MLRVAVADLVAEEQEKLKMETMDRIMNGSLSLDNPEEIPLFRQENYCMNIPDGKMMNTMGFT